MKKTAANKGGFWSGVSTYFRWCFDFPHRHGKSVLDCMWLAIGFFIKVLIGLVSVGVIGSALVGLPALVLHLIGVI